jgi:hypothetical protein
MRQQPELHPERVMPAARPGASLSEQGGDGDGQAVAERRDRGAHPAGGHAGGRDRHADQTLVDMKNAANVVLGQFEAKGHDYRADLARFVREVYALPATDDQLAASTAARRAAELERKRLLSAAAPPAANLTRNG